MPKLLLHIMKKFVFDKIKKFEDEILNSSNSIKASHLSPVRFEITEEAVKMGFLPSGTVCSRIHTLGSQNGVFKSFKSVKNNPEHPHQEASTEQLTKIENKIRSYGIFSFSYTKLTKELIFRNKAALFDSVIVLIMEMDKARINTAPSLKAGEAVHETYNLLGDKTNRITDDLRKMGFAAQASHPLMGMVYYPPLAERAGLGWIGKNGLLISPQYGPCLRISAIFTSIKNLPFYNSENSHKWIESFCEKCGKCVRKCPTQAIYKTAKDNDSGVKTYIENQKCFPFFVKTHGCSVCIKECVFNEIDYNEVKKRFLK